MRTHQENTSGLVNQARLLATYCYLHKFEGSEILKGIKVSCITNLYAKRGTNWLWQFIEDIVGSVNGDSRQLFAPAVFLLNIQYSIVKDRSLNAFHKCNEQFLSNCVQLCKTRYHFLHPRRYRSIKMAKKWFMMISEGGVAHWEAKNSALGCIDA